jgi:hypothetical protein
VEPCVEQNSPAFRAAVVGLVVGAVDAVVAVVAVVVDEVVAVVAEVVPVVAVDLLGVFALEPHAPKAITATHVQIQNGRSFMTPPTIPGASEA